MRANKLNILIFVKKNKGLISIEIASHNRLIAIKTEKGANTMFL